MTDKIMLHNILSSVLLDMGITTPVNKLEIDGLIDMPGHHWSNPGVKQLTIYAGEDKYQFVLKTLAEHSKREIAVYNYLTTIENYPIPRIYHSVYNDKHNEYWMIIERCQERDFPAPEEFWKECATLLARIHSVFWDKTKNLPSMFHLEPKFNRLADAVGRLNEFLGSLSDNNIHFLESELNVSLTNLQFYLGEIDIEHLPVPPSPDRCLIHGSFRSPEIMWRKTNDGFTPLGVDWEGCRIGHPAEDLAFAVQNLLPKEELVLFDTFMDSYLKELSIFEIQLNREILIPTTRQKSLIKIIDGVIPFLLQTYIEVRKDESYRKWCLWLKESLPYTFQYVIDTITSDCIFTD